MPEPRHDAMKATRRIAGAFAITAAVVATTRHDADRWTAIAVTLLFGSAWLALLPGRSRPVGVDRRPGVGAVVIKLPRTARLRATAAAGCCATAMVALGSTGALPFALAVPAGAAAATIAACVLVGSVLVPQCVVLTPQSLFLPGTLRLVAVSWNEVEHVATWRLLSTSMIGIQSWSATSRIHRRLSGYDWAIPAPVVVGAPGGLERVLRRLATDPLARVELDGDDAADKVAAMLAESVRS